MTFVVTTQKQSDTYNNTETKTREIKMETQNEISMSFHLMCRLYSYLSDRNLLHEENMCENREIGVPLS